MHLCLLVAVMLQAPCLAELLVMALAADNVHEWVASFMSSVQDPCPVAVAAGTSHAQAAVLDLPWCMCIMQVFQHWRALGLWDDAAESALRAHVPLYNAQHAQVRMYSGSQHIFPLPGTHCTCRIMLLFFPTAAAEPVTGSQHAVCRFPWMLPAAAMSECQPGQMI